MANLKSSKKRARQTIRKTVRNRATRSQVKTAVSNVRNAVEAGAKDVESILTQAISTIAKAGKKGTIHSRNASRKISRLMKAAHKLKIGTTAVAATKKKSSGKKKVVRKKTTTSTRKKS